MPGDRAQAALLRALLPVTGPATLIAARTVQWASATFEGARHRLALRLDAADGEDDGGEARAARLCATLGETELPMRGAFVADIVTALATGDGAPTLAIEALTIEEDMPPALVSRGARRAG